MAGDVLLMPRLTASRELLQAMLDDRSTRQFVKSSVDCPSLTFRKNYNGQTIT